MSGIGGEVVVISFQQNKELAPEARDWTDLYASVLFDGGGILCVWEREYDSINCDGEVVLLCSCRA